MLSFLDKITLQVDTLLIFKLSYNITFLLNGQRTHLTFTLY